MTTFLNAEELGVRWWTCSATSNSLIEPPGEGGSHAIAFVAGDGIGPEISMASNVSWRRWRNGMRSAWRCIGRPIGLEALAAHGVTVTDETFAEAAAADGVILGPVSTVDYPPKDKAASTRRPSFGVVSTSTPTFARRELGPASRPSSRAMDLVIVRENTEGFMPTGPCSRDRVSSCRRRTWH